MKLGAIAHACPATWPIEGSPHVCTCHRGGYWDHSRHQCVCGSYWTDSDLLPGASCPKLRVLRYDGGMDTLESKAVVDLGAITPQQVAEVASRMGASPFEVNRVLNATGDVVEGRGVGE